MDISQEEEIPHSSSTQLPPDVWRFIASRLSVKEWAKASGISKTTWNLQLDKLDLDLTHWQGLAGDSLELYEVYGTLPG